MIWISFLRGTYDMGCCIYKPYTTFLGLGIGGRLGVDGWVNGSGGFFLGGGDADGGGWSCI